MVRYALSPRWLAWHVFCVLLIAGLIGMGIWQWNVATAPRTPGGPANLNLRNLVYAFQWWIFAAFGVWFWFRFIRDQRDAEIAVAAAVEGVDGAEGDREVADGGDFESSPSHINQVPVQVDDQPISLDAPAAARAQRAQGTTSDSVDRTVDRSVERTVDRNGGE
ncbi:MAG: hypothetical protein ACOYD0_03070 [Candidatus Nanopelagicales bacterium]